MTSDPISSPRPRVLQVISHLALGGAERVAFNLIYGLRQRCDFGVFAAIGVDPGEVGQSMKRELEQMNVPLFVGTSVPIKFGGMALAGMWLARAVKKFRPHIIHLHTEVPESSYAAMVALRPSYAKIPLVRTIHNTIYWNPWRKLGRWCDKRMPRSYVACVSQGAQAAFEELRVESAAGQSPQPPVIIFNGVVVEDQPAARAAGESVRILFAGRFENQKGVDLLPEIIRRVRPKKNIQLVIHGSGTHESALKALAANPPAGWSIEVSGPVPNLSRQLPQFDLLLMPSRYEGLALLAIEAAMLGVPVIATDGPGLREGFPPDYPFIAKAGDAESFARVVQHALDDPSQWPLAAARGKEFAQKHFNVAAMCDAYENLYRHALAQ